MPTFSQHNLGLWRRPGDGACGLWSLGTGVGSYGETAFNFFGDSGVHSPIDYPNAPASPALLKKMRSDRRAIAAWLTAPENCYTLRTNHELWTTNFPIVETFIVEHLLQEMVDESAPQPAQGTASKPSIEL